MDAMACYFRISRTSTVTVRDYKSLLEAWRLYSDDLSLLGRVIVTGRLTREQQRSLPKECLSQKRQLHASAVMIPCDFWRTCSD